MAEAIDLQKFRDRVGAEKYRLLQATALLELFRRAYGRHATGLAELHAWVSNLPEQNVDPFEVLSEQQIRDLLEAHK